jgi:5-hydroxyisourate hydrolase
MGKLTTHVLDTSAGIPAGGVRIDVHDITRATQLLGTFITGVDGRCTTPLLEGEGLRSARYTLTFHVGEYFRRRGHELPDPAFFDQAVIQIGIAAPEQHYHVPLLVSPWSYSVYRGG